MKAFISCISIAMAITTQAEEEQWYDALGNLARVLPTEERREDWQPQWLKSEETDQHRFTWNTRRGYAGYASPWIPYRGGACRSYFRYGNKPIFYPAYRRCTISSGRYGLRGFYSSSGNWGIYIGR